jgi:glycosyltransferase involved in cell wall biosynthesis
VVNSIRAYGGGEGWVLATSRGLTARGHTVWLACQPGSAMEAHAGRESLPAYPVPMRNDVSTLAFSRLFRLCRHLRPEVVLLCNQRAARLAAPAARLAGVPAVVMRNGLEGSFGPKRWNRWLARTCISHFVVNAEALRTELLSYGWIPPERVTLIYNGIDLAACRPRRSREAMRAELLAGGSQLAAGGARLAARAPGGGAALTPGRSAASGGFTPGYASDAPPGRSGSEGHLILCVARLADGKGQDDLIQAVGHLLPEHPDVQLLIVGEGSRRGALETLVAEAALGSHVQFLGFRSDVPDLLAAADVVVIPSHREGLPNIALEAMAVGRPVVATAVSGTPEAVVDGETGLLVPPGRPQTLAAALDRLLAAPATGRAMGERGQARVQARFRADVALSHWEQYLCSLRSGAGVARVGA